MSLSLHIWYANCLLMKGWEIARTEVLGMSVVEDPNCPLYGTIPAPRVLQNQLDRAIESYIMLTEKQLLRAIQRRMRAEKAQVWEPLCAAIALVLHVLERDTWRLMYWTTHREEVSLNARLCLLGQPDQLLMTCSDTSGVIPRSLRC